jgi:hypothetical protein
MENFIDHRNEKIWNLLSKHYNIQIANSFNNEYGCFSKNSDAIIYVTPNNISKDSFTHELLHIYLNYKEFYLGNSIKILINQDKILSKLLSENLLEHIGNCLDHIKMFEIYINLKFDKKEFLLDYETFKCNEEDLNYLRQNFKYLGKINLYSIDFFIGKLVSILCDPNTNNNYSNELLEFRKLDLELYEIVNNLIQKTLNFDIDKKDIFNSYRDISFEFYENLKNWVTMKL